MEWKDVKMTEFCNSVADGTHDSPKRCGSGRYLITSKHIKGSSIDFENAYYISEEDYQKIIKRSKVDKWDVIISMIGAYCGFCYLEDSDYTDYAVKNVGLLKVGKELESKWLYYYLISPEGKYKLQSLRAGSTQPYISLGSLRDFNLRVPADYDCMKKVVSILSSLDAKIENNNKINANLEAQASALFKSWFVDFEPFRDGEFVESELGMIPKGWKVGTLSELIEVKYGKDHKNLEDGIIPVYGSGGYMRSVEKQLYEGESVLIPRKGTLNNVMYVNEAFWTVDTMFYSMMKMQNVAIFVYQYLITKDLASMNAGSAVPSMTADILNKMALIVPPQELLCKFDSIVQVLYKTKASLNNENQRLSSLRDTILPKLMSGEIEL